MVAYGRGGRDTPSGRNSHKMLTCHKSQLGTCKQTLTYRELHSRCFTRSSAEPVPSSCRARAKHMPSPCRARAELVPSSCSIVAISYRGSIVCRSRQKITYVYMYVCMYVYIYIYIYEQAGHPATAKLAAPV